MCLGVSAPLIIPSIRPGHARTRRARAPSGARRASRPRATRDATARGRGAAAPSPPWRGRAPRGPSRGGPHRRRPRRASSTRVHHHVGTAVDGEGPAPGREVARDHVPDPAGLEHADHGETDRAAPDDDRDVALRRCPRHRVDRWMRGSRSPSRSPSSSPPRTACTTRRTRSPRWSPPGRRRPGQAIVLASVFNLLGPLLVGAAVADTIGGIVAVSSPRRSR